MPHEWVLKTIDFKQRHTRGLLISIYLVLVFAQIAI